MVRMSRAGNLGDITGRACPAKVSQKKRGRLHVRRSRGPANSAHAPPTATRHSVGPING
jgi:hypothetical protein